MSKFLLIGSIAAMLYGDCAWGMGDDIDPWKGTSSGAGQFNAEPARGDASPNIRSRRNSTTFSRDAQTQTEQSPFEQSWSGQAHANPQQLEENRFIKDNGYRQYHYVPSNNSKIGRATPTTIISVTDDLKCWNDIAEIRYANDMSYDKLENPKVILYRNRDNSCYIILRIDGNKHGVFYGTNERSIEVGRSSFAVYDLSEDVGSFTDSVARLIYVDESGLYFVPKAENSVENVIDSYQKEGKFKFEGSVVKVLAVDGTITLNGEPITKENFFDNWIQEEREVEREVSKEKGRTVIEKVKENKTVLSTKHPKSEEILRNFYPPEGSYQGILIGKEKRVQYDSGDGSWLNIFFVNSVRNNGGKITTLWGREWVNFFVDKRLQSTKEMNVQRCEELVRNGTFATILRRYNGDKKISDIVVSNGGSTSHRETDGRLLEYRNDPRAIIWYNAHKLEDPNFVKKLKQGFAEIEKDYEYNKGTDMWIPFKIVKNL
ncbi:MAG: hypothetical protein J6P84_04115 [Alphaproteobacteria bacterium]|nr:hypothetical protein [Alphaproteobacteria bacterium]